MGIWESLGPISLWADHLGSLWSGWGQESAVFVALPGMESALG